MPHSPRLLLLRDGAVVHTVPIGPAGIRVGRAPDNDLVLPDKGVSWGHAEFWCNAGRVYVRDRGSTNGTFLNDWRVRVPLPVGDADRLRLGTTVELRVEGGGEAQAAQGPAWLVEDLVRGVLLPFGDALPGLESPDAAGTIVVEGVEVPLGQDFAHAGRGFRVAAASDSPVATAGVASAGWPYGLRVRLDGPTGPEATLEHRLRDRKCRITAENRAVLLYILARRAVDDQSRRVAPTEAGWCADDEVVTGIWGREGATMDTNGLHVLLHRVRKEIEGAGFEPEFIEKRKRALRVALVDIRVE